jgi:hypothetical protein
MTHFKNFEGFINETIFNEALDAFVNEQELSNLQKEYREYFQQKLEEFDVTSPAKLSDEKKKEFFNAVKAGWVIGKGAKK